MSLFLTHDLATEAMALARKQGFDLAGFTDLQISEEEKGRFQAFVDEGRSGEMTWFSRHQHLRMNPGRLLAYASTNETDGVQAESALVLGMLYRDPDYDRALEDARFRIARYAVGRDYHKVMKKRAAPLRALFENAGIQARICVDSAPVPEKLLARKAGLGWQGKHTNLIHPEKGSYFVLGVILLSCSLPDTAKAQELSDLCRSCNLCIEACPTGALEPYRIDARKCLSYITIEAREDRNQQADRRQGWVFGCDICQEVCPYNRSPRGRRAIRLEPELAPRPVIYDLIHRLPDEDMWRETSGMALRRVSLDQMLMNYRISQSTASVQVFNGQP
jgi:epoxyqueuosine reductase